MLGFCNHMHWINKYRTAEEIFQLCNSDITLTMFCSICGEIERGMWICLGSHDDTCLSSICEKDLNEHHSETTHPVFYSPSEAVFRCQLCETIALKKYSLQTDGLSRFGLFFRKVNPCNVRGMAGLQNLGNSCYINASIQCLNQTLSITRFFGSFQFYRLNLSKEQSMYFPYSFIHLLSNLFKMLWSDEAFVNPSTFVMHFFATNSLFTPRTQQDSQEFLSLLLDSLNSAITPLSNIFEKIFSGKLDKRIICNSCNSVTIKTEECNAFTVPIPNTEEGLMDRCELAKMMNERDKLIYESMKDSNWNNLKNLLGLGYSDKVTLYDCFSLFFKPEDLNDENNLVYCSTCERQCPSTLYYSIRESPNILIIVLKRFSYTYWGVSKINTHILLPLSLDLACFNEGNSAEQYSLYAAIEHSGGIKRGHYKSYIKNYSFGQ